MTIFHTIGGMISTAYRWLNTSLLEVELYPRLRLVPKTDKIVRANQTDNWIPQEQVVRPGRFSPLTPPRGMTGRLTVGDQVTEFGDETEIDRQIAEAFGERHMTPKERMREAMAAMGEDLCGKVFRDEETVDQMRKEATAEFREAEDRAWADALFAFGDKVRGFDDATLRCPKCGCWSRLV